MFHLCGYGVASLLLVAYGLSPLWISAKARWIEQTAASDPLRIFDFTLWISLMSVFSLLLLFPALHERSSTNIDRLKRAISVFAFGPVLAFFCCSYFWTGLVLGSKGRGSLIFHRTPKALGGGASQRQKTVVVGFILFAIVNAVIAWQHSQLLIGGLFLLQSLSIMSLFWSWRQSVVSRLWPSNTVRQQPAELP